MSLRAQSKLSLVRRSLLFAASLCVIAACLAAQSQTTEPAEEKSDGNSKCYVCHPGMKTEDVTTGHLAMDVTCDECHGASTEHMHDEMLMTEPDLLFGRSEVQAMCSNPTCHKPGAGRRYYSLADHKDPVAAEAFFKKWLGRTRPNGRTVNEKSVCTDCHGTHNLDKSTTSFQQEESADWVAAFNGKDLAGWKPSGKASWTIKSGRLFAEPAADANGATLWTADTYGDYRFAMTFRADWPVHAGICVRGGGREKGPRVEIFESDHPRAYTGSVLVPGKGLALLNLRDDLVDRESWNTISIEVRGARVQVWLNGEEIGAVTGAGPSRGTIGLHIEKHPAAKPGEFCIREILIQKLGEQTQDEAAAG